MLFSRSNVLISCQFSLFVSEQIFQKNRICKEIAILILRKRDWSDVLAAKVERIYDGAYGTQIEVSGCPAHRLRDFSFALAGYCSEEQWSRWFNEPTANTEALTMGGQA